MNWLIVARAAVVVVCALLAVMLGAPLVTWVFRRVDRQLASAAPTGEGAPGERGLVAARHQLRGGTWVGMLERLAVFSSLVAHYPEGIAVALAIKGLARYPELSAPSNGAAERFIIGTFVSVLLACGLAGVAVYVVGIIG